MQELPITHIYINIYTCVAGLEVNRYNRRNCEKKKNV